MVKMGYGYRLYLDDLPSATKYDHKDHYDENIPIGYRSKTSDDLDSFNVFNHLDITAIVHET